MDYILDILGKIGFEWKMGLFNLINFLIVFLLLKKYAFGPVMNMVNERQAKAKESVENVTKAKTELQMAERKAQEIIDESKVEARKIVELSHEQAKMLSEQMKQKAKKEIELLIAQAKRNIDIDKQEMKEGLKKETVELVMQALEKILGEKIDAKADAAIIKDMLRTLK